MNGTPSSPSPAAATSGDLTVVIPTHDRARLLDEAIRSVLASPFIHSPQQVIVVDDASSDCTPAVARSHGVRYLRVACGGPSGARNAGLEAVTTRFVAFLDDDDCWLANNMEEQLRALIANPDAGFAFGQVQLTDFDLQPFGEPTPAFHGQPRNPLLFLLANKLQLGALLFRTERVRAIGGFDESLRFNEDWQLELRMAARWPIVSVESVGSLFRQRYPTAKDADGRWHSYRAHRQITRSFRRGLPRRDSVILARAQLKNRGLTSFHFTIDARNALSEGRVSDAARYLGYAARIGPFHTPRTTVFWTTLWCLVRAWPSRRELG